MKTDTQTEIEAKYPGMATRASNGSRLAAVKLFCIECHGGNGQGARDCEQKSCFLWAVRGSWSKGKTP